MLLLCFVFIVHAYVPKLSSGVTFDDFREFQVEGQVYWLSKLAANYATAKKQCSDIAAELTLFATNSEFFAVTASLDEYLRNTPMTVEKIWIDLNATDSDGDGIYEHWWKREVFAEGVWSSHEPDGNCKTSTQRCCARLQWSQQAFENLRDTQCSVSTNHYLCTPLNECQDGTAKCKQVCVDEARGYHCSCESGYMSTEDRFGCDDVDECAPLLNPCSQACTNTVGSYFCVCGNGYSLQDDNRTCTDIDECSHGDDQCEQTCENTAGSYWCSCKTGYVLSADRVSCQDIDECAAQNDTCRFHCFNTEGSYECSCLDGYTLAADEILCEDVDECQNASTICEHTCINTNGSFTCSCHPGFILGPDMSSCVKALTMCTCPCPLVDSRPNFSPLAPEDASERIKKELLLDKATLASYRRRKISIQDSRPSYQAIGFLGITLVAMVTGWIIVPDIIRLIVAVRRACIAR